MSNPTQILILGAGYAGLMAAFRLGRAAQGKPITVTLINNSPIFVERVRLHQVAAAQRVRAHPIPRLLRGSGVRFVQGRVTRIAVQPQQVHLTAPEGEQVLRYDYLLYALGSQTDFGRVRGAQDHALAVGNAADAPRLRERLSGLAAGSTLIVVGGGLTGIETATELAERYPALRVRLVTSGRVGEGLSERGQQHVRKVLARLRVTLHENTPVQAVEADALVCANGERLPFALCVWAAALRAVPLATDSALATNERGQLLVSPTLSSLSAPNIFGAGDGAAFAEAHGVPIRMACATALPMGAQAADNLWAALHGKPQKPFGFGYAVQCVSLGRRDGLVQFVRRDDSPTERVITGRLAAFIKECICRYAAFSAIAPWLATNYRWLGQNAFSRAHKSTVVIQS